jgi:hypothetical protein
MLGSMRPYLSIAIIILMTVCGGARANQVEWVLMQWRDPVPVWQQQASVIGAVGKAAAFAVLRIAHLRQVAALHC